MKKLIISILTILLLLTFTGCKGDPTPPKEDPDTPPVVDPITPPESDPETPSEDPDIPTVEDLIPNKETIKNGNEFYIDGNKDAYRIASDLYNDFTYKLLKNSYTKNENEFFSPYSLFNTLALLGLGTSGNSKQAIEDLLGMSVYDVSEFLKKSTPYITEYEHVLLNKIWLDSSKDFVYKKGFFDLVKEYHNSEVSVNDFREAAQLAKDINDWTANATNDQIKDIVNENDISPDTVFYILNALCSRAEWYCFDEEKTYLAPFYNYDGTIGTSDAMHTLIQGYTANDKYETFTLTTESDLFFTVLVPKHGYSVYDMIDSLNIDVIEKLKNNFIFTENVVENVGEDEFGPYGTADIHYSVISLPKFSYTKKYDFTDSLKKIGLGDLFDPASADFSNIGESESGNLFIKSIKQYDSIKIDEHVIEAAGVTSAEFGAGAAGGNYHYTFYYHNIDLNKPFVYILTNGNNLFMGIISNLKEDETKIKFAVNEGYNLQIRSKASLSSNIFDSCRETDENFYILKEGDISYAYEVIENEEGKWYRIGNSAWILDEDNKAILLLD